MRSTRRKPDTSLFADLPTRASSAALQSLEHLDIGVVLLSRDRVVHYSNRAARGMAGDGFELSHGRLQVSVSEDDLRLRRRLRRLFDERASSALPLSRPSGRWSMQVSLGPVLESGGEVVFARMLITDPVSDVPGIEPFLREVYGLTAAESHVATLLVEGCDLRQAADRRGTSLETVRRQVRHVFDKTGVRRQVDLVRLVTKAASWCCRHQLPESSGAHLPVGSD